MLNVTELFDQPQQSKLAGQHKGKVTEIQIYRDP